MARRRSSTPGPAPLLVRALVLLSTIGQTVSWHDKLPEFLAPLENHTITQGRDVYFTCVVNHLQSFKVAWIKSDSRVILAMHTHMVSPNSRMSVTHNGHNTWKLHVVNVQPEDSGTYMCQVNTEPMRSLTGYLKVLTPPDIMDHTAEDSPDRLTCLEGKSVRLRCQATGNPQPEVTWRRQDNRDIVLRTSTGSHHESVQVYKSEYLQLNGVLRQEMGSYLCIASNGVPPSVSKRYFVSVLFKPVARPREHVVYAHPGGEAELECHVESWPKSLTTWSTQNGVKLIPDERHSVVETTDPKSVYSHQVTLTIHKVEQSDWGAYTCFTENSFGKSTAIITLREQHRMRTTSIPYGYVSRNKANNGKKAINALPDPEKSRRSSKDDAPGRLDSANRTELPYLGRASTTTCSNGVTLIGFIIALFCDFR